MTDQQIELYFNNRIQELKALADRGDPWVFLCASSFVEYLAKMHSGKATNADAYKKFLKDYFFRVCPTYAQFKYASGKTDMADQMYHVLRCGIVHSFSLLADPKAQRCGGRHRSIVLAHRKEGKQHLSPFVDNRTKPKIDSAVFIAEDFVDDLGKVTKALFVDSKKKTPDGKLIKKNIRAWVNQYPPIGAIILK
ncbi:MAG TPA: hypothetical protein VGK36_14905 [Candidatus Angelobacter sp.]|jgi:hypothetical protein